MIKKINRQMSENRQLSIMQYITTHAHTDLKISYFTKLNLGLFLGYYRKVVITDKYQMPKQLKHK